MLTTVVSRARCGCVSAVGSCERPGVLPGNAVLARSSTQSSAASEPAGAPGRGAKNGRSMMYAVESVSSGRTCSVPSCGPVCESAVQPCHGRKTVHWFL